MANKNYYALTFMTVDSTGIVANVTKKLFDEGFSIDDSSSTLLYGVFSMILIVNSENNYDTAEIERMFADFGYKLSVYKYDTVPTSADGLPYTLSVYGADKAGIVHDITSVLSQYSINITDLQTKVITKSETDIYIMILEILTPENIDEATWQKELTEKATSIGTDITINKIDSYEF